MTASLDITAEQRKTLLGLLRRFIPGVEVWAYGSRVKWKSRPESDLDLVVFATPKQRRQFSDLKEALVEANLPFMVGVNVWDEEPARFQEIIREQHFVLQEAEETPQREKRGWQPMRLGSVCGKIGSGATPRGGSEVYQAAGVSLIRSQNVYNDGFKRDGLVFIGDKHARELENVNVLSGDVLLNITGDSVARVCQVPDEVLPARVNQHVAIIRPKENILDARFLRYYLINPQMQAHMLNLAGAGATRNALTKGMIESFEIKAPSFLEQQAIASVLGSLDDKIELNRRMNETLEALAQTLFKNRFVLSALPEGWCEGSILEVSKLISGGTPKTERKDYWNGNILWASAKDVSQCRQTFLVATERTITDKGVEESSAQLIPAFCTVVVARGATTGRMAMFGREMAMNQTCYALASTVGAPFMLHCQLRHEMGGLVHAAHGSVFDTITTATFANSKVVLPTKSAVEGFERTVSPLFYQILANTRESRTLAELRDALLPKLFSREVRVPANEKSLKAES